MVGNICYRFVAKNRSFFGKISTKILLEVPASRLNPGKLISAIVLFCSGLCLIWNLSFLPGLGLAFPSSLSPIMHILRINQLWDMFAPKPLTESGWYVIPGILADKTEFDVWNMKEGKVSFDKPNLVSETYISQRWRKYLMNIWLKKHRKHRLYFGKYLCKRWNRNRKIVHSKKIQQFDIYFMEQKVNNSIRLSPPKPIKIWTHHCFKV